MSNKTKSREQRLAQQRLYKRRRYLEIINDPELLALEKEKRRIKYLKRKESKKAKSINEQTSRSQREQRKKWRENSKRYRMRKKEEKHTEVMPEVFQIKAEPSESSDDVHDDQLVQDPLHHDCPVVLEAVRRVRYKELQKQKLLMRSIEVLKAKDESQRKQIDRLRRKIELLRAEKMSNEDMGLETDTNTAPVVQNPSLLVWLTSVCNLN